MSCKNTLKLVKTQNIFREGLYGGVSEVQQCGLGAGAAEDGGEVGDGADLGFFVALFYGNDALAVGQFFAVNSATAPPRPPMTE